MKQRDAVPEAAEIVDLTHEAKGVARIDGRTAFVADALPGELVTLRRVGRHRGVDEAVLVSVERPSPDRVAPACPHFGTCGGCALQHLAPAAQVRFKQSQLVESLARIGGVTPGRLLEPLASPPWGYRRRARLGVKLVARKGRIVVGFRERSAPYVADLHECRVLASPADRLIDPLAGLVGRLTIAARVPQVEVAVAENGCALVLRVLDPPGPADLELLHDFELRHGVRLYLQAAGPQSVAPLTAGGETLRYTLPSFGVTLEFEPTDFIQVNAALNEAMVSQAIELLAPGTGDRVLDLFAGLGNFSLPLARRAAEVVGVDGDAALVERARENARCQGIANVSYVTADLAQAVQDAPWSRQRYDRVLLDPPRAGAREVLPAVGAGGAGRVVYISCHPGSLARDAGVLVRDHGFRLVAAGVMDMFPHTTHVEAMAVFER